MGSKGGGGSSSNQMGFQATTSTYTPDPVAYAAYKQALQMAGNVANIPYENYQGQLVAGFTPDQMAAMQGTREMQGMAQPYINSAASAINAAVGLADPRNFSPAALEQYYNPYQQNVIESTRQMMAQQNAQQQADLTAKAIQQGAYGGDRSGIARAALMGQQNLANQQVLSGLQQQGYQQAVNQYNQQQQQAVGAAQGAAYSLGQLGLQSQQAALQGIQALLGTGGMQQQLAQQQLTAAYNQFLAARAYPYQQSNFYAGIASAIGPNMGGTTNTTGFGTQQGQTQQSGGGGGGAGILGSAMSMLPMLFSDKDDKTDIKYLGKDEDSGEKLYSYRYKGDPKSYPKVVGPMAQDIEKHSPEKIHEVGGHKIVEGLGHLAPSQRQHRESGGLSSIYSRPQSPQYSADPNFDPGLKTGLEAIIDPYMADQIARSKYVTAQTQQQPEAVQEQLETRNPDFNLFPYFQEGQQPKSGFDAPPDELYNFGGRVHMQNGGFGMLGSSVPNKPEDFSAAHKGKTPYGAVNPIESLPITPARDIGRAMTEGPANSMMKGWLPKLPGGGPSGGGGGGGSGGGGGGGGMPKLPKMGSSGSRHASAGSEAPAAGSAEAAAPDQAAGAEKAPEAAQHADVAAQDAAAATPHEPAMPEPAPEAPAVEAAPDASAGLGGIGGGLGDMFSGFGGFFGFKDGGRIHMADGGVGGAGNAAGATSGLGAAASSGDMGRFTPALQAPARGLNIPGLIGQSGTGTLGSVNTPRFVPAPTGEGKAGPDYRGWLDRAMKIDPGPQLTPEQQGVPALAEPGKYKTRADFPEDVPVGYSTTLSSNVFNPKTGLFNLLYKPYYMPKYAEGGRVGMQDGGRPSNFYTNIYNSILSAARKQGAPHPEVLARLGAAQSANETGWGKHAPGQNYFGIKGPGGRYATKEMVDGRTVGTTASFRGYPSMQESAKDYVRLMSKPRYSDVYSAETPREAIAAQARSGYASDRAYGSKLAKIDALASKYQPVAPYGTVPPSTTRIATTRPLTGERQVVAQDERNVPLPPTRPTDLGKPVNPNAPSYMSAPPLAGTTPKPSFIEHPEQTANQPSQLYLGPQNTAPAIYSPMKQPLPSDKFTLASLNPIQPAMADDNVAPRLPSSIVPKADYDIREDRGLAAGTQVTPQLYGPTSLDPFPSNFTGIAGDPTEPGFIGGDFSRPGFTLPNLNRDMAGVRSMGFGDLPLMPFSPDAAPVAADEVSKPAKATPTHHREARHEEAPVAKETGKFFGDYRDVEPFKSDPIGGFFDKLSGDVPTASAPGTINDMGGGFDLGDLGGAGSGIDLGGLGDILPFSYGGRVHMQDGGDPLADVDPELMYDAEKLYPTQQFEPSDASDEASYDDAGFTPNRVVAADQGKSDVGYRPKQPGLGLGQYLPEGIRESYVNPANWSPEFSQSLLAASLATMASPRQSTLAAIGEGGLRGLEYYQAASAGKRGEEAATERLQHQREREQQSDAFRMMEINNRRMALEAQERARKAGRIGIIGRDEFGNPQFGYVTGEKVGQPYEPVGSKPYASAVPDTKNLHGQEYLDSIDPNRAARIKAIAEGKEELPPGRYMEGIRQAVTQYDPSYSTQRKKVRDAFSATEPTKAGGQIIAGNTALGHLGELSDAAHALGNTGFKPLNWIKQHGASWIKGNPELEAFNAVKDRFTEEATKFYRGTGGTEADIQRAINRLGEANTPQELDKVIAQEAKLFESKVSALEDQWRKTMGSSDIQAGNEDYGVIRGHAREALDKIQSRIKGGSGSIESLAAKYGMTPEQLRAKYEQMKQGRQ